MEKNKAIYAIIIILVVATIIWILETKVTAPPVNVDEPNVPNVPTTTADGTPDIAPISVAPKATE